MDCGNYFGGFNHYYVENAMKQQQKMNERKVILGAGESGVGAAILANHKGFDVFVSDNGTIKEHYKTELQQHGIVWEENQHSRELILNAGEIIKSPGIPETAALVQEAVAKGIPVVSEIEFAGRYISGTTICVTGSNGKTTTTDLIYFTMKKAGMNVALAGNIGKSLARQVATAQFDYYVIELSSFQLDGMYDFRANIAILLNITPDHLDRYGYQMQNYVDSKFRITQNQTADDVFIYGADDEIILSEIKKRNLKAQQLPFTQKRLLQENEDGAYVNDNQIIIKYKNTEFTMLAQELALQGKHNTYNTMAAGISSKVLKIRKKFVRDSFTEYKGVPHRLEPVIRVGGVLFYNDSKATNVNSTWFALESMTARTVWIAGGVDKGNDYNELAELVREKVKTIVCIGKDNAKIHDAFGEIIPVFDAASMPEAVSKAYKMAGKGENVLLSPACASFDRFKNYEDRGNQFKKAVYEL